MVRPTPAQWRCEAGLLALTLVVAFATPPFFDLAPLNLLSVLLVVLHLGSRVWRYRGQEPSEAHPDSSHLA
jgi:hypothetical protein